MGDRIEVNEIHIRLTQKIHTFIGHIIDYISNVKNSL